MAVVRTDNALAPLVDGTTHGAAHARRTAVAAAGAARSGSTVAATPRGALRALHHLGRRAVRAVARIVAAARAPAPGTRLSPRRIAPRLLAPLLLAALPCAGMHAALAAPDAAGAPVDGGQNFELVKDAALNFLVQQTEGLPGKVTISLVPTTPHGLTACGALEPFVPPGVRLWGRAMVGVRCNGERPWTIYLQARIGVIGDYFVAARTLNVGDTIGPQDLEPRHGDLTALPATLITNPNQVVGAVASNAVTAGFPLRSDMVHAALAIRYGQQVRVVARGDGFSVSSEGSALANATVGQSVRVRTPSGTVVSGIAQADTTVEVPM